MDFATIMQRLAAEADSDALEGMGRYGIAVDSALGVSVPTLRRIAKEAGPDHALAARLWSSGIHEARILAAFIDEPERVTERQMERWVRAVDSWDLCDLLCSNLFDRTPFAWKKAREWASRDEEFVRRAGFAMMAALAVHDKEADDAAFESLLPLIVQHAEDDRNYVKKAVNWALRQIGKRNSALNRKAVRTAKRIAALDSRPARWVASDALKELESDAVRNRLEKRRGATSRRTGRSRERGNG